MDDADAVECISLDELEQVLRCGPVKEHACVRLCTRPTTHLLMIFHDEDMRDAWLGVIKDGLSDCFRFESQQNRRVLYIYEK
jgi:hypothetical protein